MYGLLMKKEYLTDILNKKTFIDARLINTDIRGKIGLVESQTYKLYGYVNLYDVHQITYEDFVKWHLSDDYNLDVVYEKLKNDNMVKRYAYAYDLSNPEALEIPLILNPQKLNNIWIEFDEKDSNKGYIQESLF